MTADLLEMMSGGRDGEPPFSWPDEWPDDVDREHMTIWRRRAEVDENVAWGPRAIVDTDGRMVGHAGFHLPPRALDTALGDSTFVGERRHAAGGVVEIGYTVFPRYRQNGYATEAVDVLLAWAKRTGEVGAVLATLAQDNDASRKVLERVGGFVQIGSCRDPAGVVEDVYRRDL